MSDLPRTRSAAGVRSAGGALLLAATALLGLGACDTLGEGQRATNPLEPRASASHAELSDAQILQDPEAVTDLQVLTTGPASAMLRFTQVEDGAGGAANYHVRFAPTPMGWGWGRAAHVLEGSCAGEVMGTEAGTDLTCVVGGLAAGVAYDFQLVSYRGLIADGSRVYGGLSNVATGTTADQASDPESVTDLSVRATAAGSATLAFTQVADGEGGAANYHIRYTRSPIGWGWGSATRVEEGSCADEVMGTAPGDELTCVVEGLEPGVGYDFQLISYRGLISDGSRVYAGLSNVATGHTTTSGGGDDGGGDPGGSGDPGDGGDGDDGGDPPADEEPARDPEPVTDLAIESRTESSATVRFTEVDDGTGGASNYEVRYTTSPMGWGWGSANRVQDGTCSGEVMGTAPGEPLTCTVEGLAPGTLYDFRLVSYRGLIADGSRVYAPLSNIATARTLTADGAAPPTSTGAGECSDPDPAWIWCDDFERDRTSSYFEYVDRSGSFVRREGVGRDGSYGMRVRYQSGQVSAGSLKLAFGRTPSNYFRPVDAGSADYQEVYWRVYVRLQEGWVGGGGDKMSRATSMVSDNWAQSMIAHVWSGRSSRRDYLVIDPASGTDSAGNLRTTQYNDFPNLRWLGGATGTEPLFHSDNAGQWFCVEARVRLNTPGLSDGIFELWVNDERDARVTGLNWRGRYDRYGINAVFLENYWNDGSPRTQERYFDNFVVSTERIGC